MSNTFFDETIIILTNTVINNNFIHSTYIGKMIEIQERLQVLNPAVENQKNILSEEQI